MNMPGPVPGIFMCGSLFEAYDVKSAQALFLLPWSNPGKEMVWKIKDNLSSPIYGGGGEQSETEGVVAATWLNYTWCAE